MEITLDGLIWDLGVFNYRFGYMCDFALCHVTVKASESRLLMMQKMVALSSFSVFSIMNPQLLWYQYLN